LTCYEDGSGKNQLVLGTTNGEVHTLSVVQTEPLKLLEIANNKLGPEGEVQEPPQASPPDASPSNNSVRFLDAEDYMEQ
jgi:hypothetical protein